jgi:hypothetical protein
MKERLIILDFDNTIFDSRQFYRDMSMVLQREFGIDAQEFTQEQPQYLLAEDHSYDFFHHIKARGLKRAEVSLVLRKQLGGGDYLYPDVIPFLETHHDEHTEVVILTVGVEDWQRFKLSFCPSLAHLVHHIISVHKGTHLAKHLKLNDDGRLGLDIIAPGLFWQILLMDDKPATFADLPKPIPGLSLYRIRRPDDPKGIQPTPPQATELTSLTDLPT